MPERASHTRQIWRAPYRRTCIRNSRSYQCSRIMSFNVVRIRSRPSVAMQCLVGATAQGPAVYTPRRGAPCEAAIKGPGGRGGFSLRSSGLNCSASTKGDVHRVALMLHPLEGAPVPAFSGRTPLPRSTIQTIVVGNMPHIFGAVHISFAILFSVHAGSQARRHSPPPHSPHTALCSQQCLAIRQSRSYVGPSRRTYETYPLYHPHRPVQPPTDQTLHHRIPSLVLRRTPDTAVKDLVLFFCPGSAG